jgi:hypothetical protein
LVKFMCAGLWWGEERGVQTQVREQLSGGDYMATLVLEWTAGTHYTGRCVPMCL